MKPAPFDYVAARSVADVVNHLAATDREVKVLAGGQSLIPVLNMRMARPEVLVDITGIEDLQRIEVSSDGQLRIGAAARQSDAAEHPEVAHGWPALTRAIGLIGHPQIRNSGTVCGSLVHADSSAELPAVAVLLDAVLEVRGADGTREIRAEDFFLGTFTTALGPDELVTAVRFPAPPEGTGTDIIEFAQRRGDFATVGVTTRLTRAGSAIDTARAVFFGVGSTPLRLPVVEGLMTGRAPDEELSADLGRALQDHLSPPSDVHASAEHRVELATHLLNRSITTAWENCR